MSKYIILPGPLDRRNATAHIASSPTQSHAEPLELSRLHTQCALSLAGGIIGRSTSRFRFFDFPRKAGRIVPLGYLPSKAQPLLWRHGPPHRYPARRY